LKKIGQLGCKNMKSLMENDFSFDVVGLFVSMNLGAYAQMPTT